MAELIDFGSKVQYTNESPMRWGSEQAISGANKIREYNRQRAVEKAISDNYNPETQRIDEQSLGKQLAGLGFGGTAEQVINQLKAERTKMSSEVADAIKKDYDLVQLEMLSPARFMEKWGNTTEATAIVDKLKSEIPKSTTPVTPSQETKRTATDAIKDKFPSYFPQTKKDGTIEGAVDETSVSVPGNEFVSKAEEAKLPDIIPATEYTTKTTGPSTTTGYLALDRAPKTYTESSIGQDNLQTPTPFDTRSMTKGAIQNLGIFLANAGITFGEGKTLEDAISEYEQNATKGISRPQLPILKTTQNMQDYNQKMADYRANVAKAITDAREKLRSGQSDIQALEQGRKSHESTYADVSDKDIFYGPVTLEQAKRIKLIRKHWDTLQNAGRSWQDAWSAAKALALIEGNQTLENTVSNVLEMGAMPDKQAAVVRSILSNNPEMSNIAFAKGFDWLVGEAKKQNIDLNIGPRGADSAWGDRVVDQFSREFEDSNAKMQKFHLNTTPRTASDSVSDKKKESSAGKKAPSKPSTSPRKTFSQIQAERGKK